MNDELVHSLFDERQRRLRWELARRQALAKLTAEQRARVERKQPRTAVGGADDA